MAIDPNQANPYQYPYSQPGSEYAAPPIPPAPGMPPESGYPAGGQQYPYAGQPYQYPGYPPYPYAGPMPPSTNGMAIASLVCSIGSYILAPVIGAILGVIFGHIALGQIRASEGREEGRGMALAGLILGYIHLALAVLFVVFILLLVSVTSQRSGI